MQQPYRLDRTKFSILSYKEADKEFNNHWDMSWQERFRLHQHLNAAAYGYAGSEPPRMDKTVFSYGKTGDVQYFSS